MPDAAPGDVVLAVTTFASNAAAVSVVRTLLARRLIACGTLLPGGRSLFHWDGKLQEDAETVVLLKTVQQRIGDIQIAFAELHPYTTPELLVFAATDGLPAYLSWIVEQTGNTSIS